MKEMDEALEKEPNQVKISVRIPVDLLDWVNSEIQRKRGSGGEGALTSISNEIRLALTHRKISLMPRDDRERLLRRAANL